MGLREKGLGIFVRFVGYEGRELIGVLCCLNMKEIVNEIMDWGNDY